MGYLRIHCGSCRKEWHVYHRDINNEHTFTCPHCGAKIDEGTRAQIVTGFGEMIDSELELVKDAEQYKPMFSVDYISSTKRRRK